MISRKQCPKSVPLRPSHPPRPSQFHTTFLHHVPSYSFILQVTTHATTNSPCILIHGRVSTQPTSHSPFNALPSHSVRDPRLTLQLSSSRPLDSGTTHLTIHLVYSSVLLNWPFLFNPLKAIRLPLFTLHPPRLFFM